LTFSLHVAQWRSPVFCASSPALAAVRSSAHRGEQVAVGPARSIGAVVAQMSAQSRFVRM
jgi:hypothetical protein